ncbi:unnamed protein product [Parajaminaea phylloscopi]
MLTSLRILHPPSSSNNTSPHPVIILSHENHKILFNAPEGALRTLNSRKAIVSSKTDTEIYVQDATLAARGLPGLLMSLADAQGQAQRSIHLYGPPSTAHALATARFFAKRVNRQLYVHEGPAGPGGSKWPKHRDGRGTVVRPLPSWPESWFMKDEPEDRTRSGQTREQNGRKRRRSRDDQEVSIATDGGPRSNVEYDALAYSRPTSSQLPNNSAGDRALATAQDMFKAPTSSSSLSKDTLDDPSAIPRGRVVSPAWDQNRLPRPLVPAHSHEGAPSSQPLAYGYALTLPTMAGKLDPQRASMLGIKPGPALGQLHAGRTVKVMRPVGWASWSDADKKKWAALPSRPKAPKGKQTGPNKNKPQPAEEESVAMEEVTIQPEECVDPPVAGPVVLLLYVPSLAHIASFTSQGNRDTIVDATTQRDGDVALMVHTSPLNVLRDARYQEWVKATSTPSTYHIVTAHGVGRNTVLYPSASLLFLRLSILDDSVFTFPPYSLQTDAEALASAMPKGINLSNVSILDSDTTVELQPRVQKPRPTSHVAQAYADDVTFDVHAAKGTEDHRRMLAKMAFEEVDTSGNDPEPVNKQQKGALSRQKARREALQTAWRDYCSVAEDTKSGVAQAAQAAESVTKEAWEGIRVTTLGTGSAGPSKYRNVAATLVTLPGRFFPKQKDQGQDQGQGQDQPGYVLLDAGESTLGQLAQRFGRGRELDKILCRLKLVFISHIHADHCAGIAHVLRARALLKPSDRLYLVANMFTRRFLEEWSDLEDIGLSSGGDEGGSVVLLESEHLDHRTGLTVEGRSAKEQQAAYLAQLEDGFRPGFERWAAKVREEVISAEPFAGLTPDELIAEEGEVNRRARQIMESRNPHLRGGRDPDFSRSARNLFDGSKKGDREATQTAVERMREDLGPDFVVTTAEVDHRARHCYGVVIRINHQPRANGGAAEQFAFSFSGDTRPTANLEEAARGVDLYIHEATMQEDEADEAYHRGHSTIQGAIQSGHNAEAKVVLLTHFSQRYPKMPRFNLSAHERGVANGHGHQDGKGRGSSASAGAGAERPVVAVGMDLLDIGMNDMWKMERYLPAIDVLFKAEAVGVEDGNGNDGGEEGITTTD